MKSSPFYAYTNGPMSGQIHTVWRSHFPKILDNPFLYTLNLIKRDNRETSLAVYFWGLYASSYFFEVLKSQICPPKLIQKCTIISGYDYIIIDYTGVRSMQSINFVEYETWLIVVSNELESLGKSSFNNKGAKYYSGGLLVPTYPKD